METMDRGRRHMVGTSERTLSQHFSLMCNIGPLIYSVRERLSDPGAGVGAVVCREKRGVV